MHGDSEGVRVEPEHGAPHFTPMGQPTSPPKDSRFLGMEFGTGRGVTQGDPTSPMIFNIVANTVVIAVLEVVCRPQEDRHGMGWAAGERNLVLYMDGGRIAGRYHIWVQDALMVTAEMLQRVGLETNLEKTKALVCTLGYIWGNWSKAAYKRRATGEGEIFRERKRAKVSYSECGVTVVASSLKRHTERQNIISVSQKRDMEIVGRGGTSYLYVFLPPGDEDDDMPGDRMSGSNV